MQKTHAMTTRTPSGGATVGNSSKVAVATQTAEEDAAVGTGGRKRVRLIELLVHSSDEDGSDDDEEDDDDKSSGARDEETPDAAAAAANSTSVDDCDPERAVNLYSDEELRYYDALGRDERDQVDLMEAALRSVYRGDKPLRFKVLESNMDEGIKALAIQRLNLLSGCSAGDHAKTLNWVSNLAKLPIGVYNVLPVTSASPPEEVAAFLRKTRDVLDAGVYGHVAVKKQILVTLAKWVVNRDAKGIVLGIQGPPGVGKTTLVKDGICKALGLPFAFVPLGGANDSSYLDGFSYTYEGSAHGKVVDVLIKAKCMNPIICFDELDKVADNCRGNEIYNVLMALTDATQNDQFSDKYFSDVAFDLSRCIVVFTYNDESRIHPVLKDRMVRLSTDDYKPEDKRRIFADFMLPKALRTYGFAPDEVRFDDDMVSYFVNASGDASGMRNVARNLDAMLGTLNLKKLVRDDVFYGDKLDVKFPCVVTRRLVDAYVLRERDAFAAVSHMYL